MASRGFKCHFIAELEKGLQQRRCIGMGQGFTAGEFHKGRVRALVGRAEAFLNQGKDGFHVHEVAFGEGVGGVAVGAAQGAAREANEEAGATGPGTFALDAEKDFVHLEAVQAHLLPPSRVRISPVR